MRKAVVLVLLLVSVATANQPLSWLPVRLTAGHPLVRGLVAWYPVLPTHAAGATWWDMAGRNHGALIGGISRVSDTTGRFAGAISLDGNDDYVSIPSAPSLNFGTGDFSVCLWATLPSLAENFEYALVQKTTSYQGAAGWAVEASTIGAWPGWKIVFYITTNADYSVSTISGGIFLSAPDTHHVCAIRVGTTIALYYEGLFGENFSDPAVSASVNNSLPIEVGRAITEWETGGNTFGLIRDLRLYNRALTAGEVAQLARCKAPDYCGTLSDDQDVFSEVVAPSTSRRRAVSQ
jgi:hypothetical protein